MLCAQDLLVFLGYRELFLLLLSLAFGVGKEIRHLEGVLNAITEG